ncbi:hypothetical protein ACTG0T_09155 [Halococcus morrhuae DSM 1307]|uniref:hypothetical protein n=1 Tax=Halococcus morrhuae TaxID=2250 RepID=UPI0012677CE3|nr:hypothetical protein [Halococcus morrhuae]
MAVAVDVSVVVGVAVGVSVAVTVGVSVAVAVGVSVAVAVGVDVSVGVSVAVSVGVAVDVAVGVGVAVGVAVAVGVGVRVLVAVFVIEVVVVVVLADVELAGVVVDVDASDDVSLAVVGADTVVVAGVAVPLPVEDVVVDSTGESERALQPANNIETTTRTTSTERRFMLGYWIRYNVLNTLSLIGETFIHVRNVLRWISTVNVPQVQSTGPVGKDIESTFVRWLRQLVHCDSTQRRRQALNRQTQLRSPVL